MTNNKKPNTQTVNNYTTPAFIKQIITRQYQATTDENGNIVSKELPVGVLPNIELYTKIGGTNYYVCGCYSGTGNVEDKISQILKREIEV